MKPAISVALIIAILVSLSHIVAHNYSPVLGFLVDFVFLFAGLVGTPFALFKAFTTPRRYVEPPAPPVVVVMSPNGRQIYPERLWTTTKESHLRGQG